MLDSSNFSEIQAPLKPNWRTSDLPDQRNNIDVFGQFHGSSSFFGSSVNGDQFKALEQLGTIEDLDPSCTSSASNRTYTIEDEGLSFISDQSPFGEIKERKFFDEASRHTDRRDDQQRLFFQQYGNQAVNAQHSHQINERQRVAFAQQLGIFDSQQYPFHMAADHVVYGQQHLRPKQNHQGQTYPQNRPTYVNNSAPYQSVGQRPLNVNGVNYVSPAASLGSFSHNRDQPVQYGSPHTVFSRTNQFSTLNNFQAMNSNGTNVVQGQNLIYHVQFKCTSRFYTIGGTYPQKLAQGEIVVVEADRGEDVGVIIDVIPMKLFIERRALYRCGCDEDANVIGRILRIASASERQLLPQKYQDEESVLQLCRELAYSTYRLPMVIQEVDYQFDRHKLTIYYVSDTRVDFREFVRDLFSAYKARIWMTKINTSKPVSLEQWASVMLATGMQLSYDRR